MHYSSPRGHPGRKVKRRACIRTCQPRGVRTTKPDVGPSGPQASVCYQFIAALARGSCLTSCPLCPGAGMVPACCLPNFPKLCGKELMISLVSILGCGKISKSKVSVRDLLKFPLNLTESRRMESRGDLGLSKARLSTEPCYEPRFFSPVK